MDIKDASIVIAVTLILVVAFNLMIYFAYGRKESPNTFQMLRGAFGSFKNPWKVEDDALAELSEKIEHLQSLINEQENPGPEIDQSGNTLE